MSSAAKAAANRLNAQASTGPQTPEGKAATRLNAVAHGLSSKEVVLPHESREEYDAILQGLIQDHKPASENERLLVERVAQAYWRLQRCYGVERAFLENRIDAAQQESPDIDPDTAMARLFVDKTEAARMRLLMRYLGAAQRAFYKASSDLSKAQADRRKNAAEQEQNEAFAAMYADAPRSLPATVGFVSHAALNPPAALATTQPVDRLAISWPNAEPPAPVTFRGRVDNRLSRAA